MAGYDPHRAGTWKHAGTFNNNTCSMAAGVAALGQVYTPQRAVEFFEWSEVFRNSLNHMFAEKSLPMFCSGLGSMFAIQFMRKPPHQMVVRNAVRQALHALLHMELLLQGVLICSRGDMFLSLPMNASDLTQAHNAIESFADRHGLLIASLVES